MTVVDLWRVVKKYRWLMISISFGIALLVGVYTLLQRPLYSASVVMISANTQEGLGVSGRLGAQIGSLIGVGSAIQDVGASKDEAVALLNSRQFTEQFIGDWKLLPVLFQRRWDAAQNRWKVKDNNEIPTLEDGFQKFDQDVRDVREDDATGLVTLEIVWTDRVAAAQWANALVDRLNERLRQRTISEAQRSNDYLNKQLESANLLELRQAIFNLIEKNVSKIMLADARRDFAFRVIDPALVPDADHNVSPHLFLRVSLGLVVGFILGLMIALAHAMLREER